MENLKKIREEKGYSMIYMASKLGIDRSTYWKYENRKLRIDVDMLKKMADILNVSVEKII